MDKLRLPDSDFALTTDALAFMQGAYKYLENIALMGGTDYMLTGGEESNGTAAPGIVVLNGEVMPFKGGTVQQNIRVVTVTDDITVGVGQRQQVTKYAEFGTSTDPADNYVWADLQKTPRVADSLKLNGKDEAQFAAASHTHWDPNVVAVTLSSSYNWDSASFIKLYSLTDKVKGILIKLYQDQTTPSYFDTNTEYVISGAINSAFSHTDLGYALRRIQKCTVYNSQINYQDATIIFDVNSNQEITMEIRMHDNSALSVSLVGAYANVVFFNSY